MRINRLIEIMVILLNRKNVTVKYLSEYFEVSRKTIYGDLDILLVSGIPINYGDNKEGYITISENFNFTNRFQMKEIIDEEVRDVDYYQKYVNNEERMSYTKEMWNDFTKNRRKDLKDLDPRIFHSWVRCQQRRVPIYSDQSNFLPGDEIEKYDLKKKSKDRNVQYFCELAEKIGWNMVVYDKDYQIKHIINPIEKNLYMNIYPYVGYSRDVKENTVGTNAIALALQERETTLIFGYQHYQKAFHEISTIAAPIFKNGKIYEVIDVVFVHDAINPETKGLVTAIARLYEMLVLNNYSIDTEIEKNLYGEEKRLLQIKEPILDGKSDKWKEFIKILQKISKLDSDLILFAEKGSGKKSASEYIHYKSKRRFESFTIIDFSLLDKKEQKKKLFGDLHEAGIIEKINGGTIIVENLKDIDANLIDSFTSFLKDKKICRLGEKKAIYFDVRLIFLFESFNGLDEKIMNNLPIIQIKIPLLKDRPEDVEEIVLKTLDAYIKKNKMNKREVSELVLMIKNEKCTKNVGELVEYLKEMEKN
jgi:transcriptional regulator of acetoin/glycerol metabolism